MEQTDEIGLEGVKDMTKRVQEVQLQCMDAISFTVTFNNFKTQNTFTREFAKHRSMTVYFHYLRKNKQVCKDFSFSDWNTKEQAEKEYKRMVVFLKKHGYEIIF